MKQRYLVISALPWIAAGMIFAITAVKKSEKTPKHKKHKHK